MGRQGNDDGRSKDWLTPKRVINGAMIIGVGALGVATVATVRYFHGLRHSKTSQPKPLYSFSTPQEMREIINSRINLRFGDIDGGGDIDIVTDAFDRNGKRIIYKNDIPRDTLKSLYWEY